MRNKNRVDQSRHSYSKREELEGIARNDLTKSRPKPSMANSKSYSSMFSILDSQCNHLGAKDYGQPDLSSSIAWSMYELCLGSVAQPVWSFSHWTFHDPVIFNILGVPLKLGLYLHNSQNSLPRCSYRVLDYAICSLALVALWDHHIKLYTPLPSILYLLCYKISTNVIDIVNFCY